MAPIFADICGSQLIKGNHALLSQPQCYNLLAKAWGVKPRAVCLSALYWLVCMARPVQSLVRTQLGALFESRVSGKNLPRLLQIELASCVKQPIGTTIHAVEEHLLAQCP